MGRFVEGAERSQCSLLPECLEDWVDADNPVQVIDAFVEALDLLALGFSGAKPANTGRPAYHPAVLLKLYIYGYTVDCGSPEVDSVRHIAETGSGKDGAGGGSTRCGAGWACRRLAPSDARAHGRLR